MKRTTLAQPICESICCPQICNLRFAKTSATMSMPGSLITEMSGKIWSESVAACQKASVPATTSLVLSSVNSMIDVTTTRAVAFETHPPAVVFWGMGILVLASALLAGYSLAEAQTRSLVHMFVYSAIFAIAVYVIIDLEFPRVGLIRIDSADHFLVDLRNNM